MVLWSQCGRGGLTEHGWRHLRVGRWGTGDPTAVPLMSGFPQLRRRFGYTDTEPPACFGVPDDARRPFPRLWRRQVASATSGVTFWKS